MKKGEKPKKKLVGFMATPEDEAVIEEGMAATGRRTIADFLRSLVYSAKRKNFASDCTNCQ